MSNPASELFRLFSQQANARHETLDWDTKQLGEITTVGIQRSGTARSYCATFQADGTCFYAGQGKGLEGERIGKIDKGLLWSLIELLAVSDLDTLADSYQYAADWVYESGALFDAFLLIQRGEDRRVICSVDGAGTPLLKIALSLLDILLDQADWEGKPFTIQRTPPPPDPRRQKRVAHAD